MALAYRSLTSEQKAQIDRDVKGRDAAPAAPDAAMLAAWEADHYAHTLLLAAETDDEAKAEHTAAIKALEAAVHAGRRAAAPA